jgi:hypothetical protein
MITQIAGSEDALKYSRESLFDLERMDDDTYRIAMQGALPFGWERHLTLGLSIMNINILWGSAKRLTRSQWQGELIVEPLYGHVDMVNLDINEVLKRGRSMCKREKFVPSLTNFELRDCMKDNGTLYASVKGEDTLGFLAGLFTKFDSCMLFPVKLDIGTSGGMINDEFHLIGAAGMKVSETMKKSAEEALTSLLKK